MSANQARFPVATMARVLGVSKAGYYAWLRRPPSDHALADAALLKRIRTVHATSRQIYNPVQLHSAPGYCSPIAYEAEMEAASAREFHAGTRSSSY